MERNEYSEVFVERLTESQIDLRAFVFSLMPESAGSAEDVIQETNLSMIRNSASYDPVRPFRAWMFAIARRRVMDWRRSQTKEKLVFDDELVMQIADTICEDYGKVDGTLLRALQTCKEKLDERQRTLLNLRYAKNLPQRKIAARCNMDSEAVHNSLAYIRRKLAACVRNECMIDNAPEDVTAAPPDDAKEFARQIFIEQMLLQSKLRVSPKRRRSLAFCLFVCTAAAAGIFAVKPNGVANGEQSTCLSTQSETKGTEMNAIETVAAAAMVAIAAKAEPPSGVEVPANGACATLSRLCGDRPKVWQTAFTNELSVCWRDFSDADKTLLSISGNTGVSTIEIGKGTESISVPRPDTEELQTLTLSFIKDGAIIGTQTAKLAFVKGVAHGNRAEGVLVDTPVNATWSRAKRPVAKNACNVIGWKASWLGEETASFMGGTAAAEGWSMWTPSSVGVFSLDLQGENTSLSAQVENAASGTVIYLF